MANPETRHIVGVKLPDAKTDQLEILFLKRIEKLAKTLREKGEQLNPLGIRLVNWSIFSTYLDLIQMGMAQQANEALKTILANQQKENKPTSTVT